MAVLVTKIMARSLCRRHEKSCLAFVRRLGPWSFWVGAHNQCKVVACLLLTCDGVCSPTESRPASKALLEAEVLMGAARQLSLRTPE